MKKNCSQKWTFWRAWIIQTSWNYMSYFKMMIIISWLPSMFFFFAKRNCCFFIRYCTGGELFDKIKSMNFFSEKLAADYMKQILSAIVYCHSKSIVHRFFFFCLFFDSLFVRDLKPENLLLESKKSNSPVKVIDFGTSRKFSSNIKMSKRLGTVLIYFYGFYLLLFLTLFF